MPTPTFAVLRGPNPRGDGVEVAIVDLVRFATA